MGSYRWLDLPERVRAAIEQRCGPVADVAYPSAGRCSDFSATVYADRDSVFVKGSRTDSPRAWMHRNEARVSRFLPALAPRLLWQLENDGWLLHGFEHVAGRHADLSPNSADLPLVATAVSTLGKELSPCPPVEARHLADQWERLSAWHRIKNDPPNGLDNWTLDNLDEFLLWEERAIEAVAGNSLLHTDLHALNILMDGSARIIDWAWSRRGAIWVDTAFLVIRLIAAGHEPERAEEWADTVPAWHEASARTAFAVAVYGIWIWLAREDPLPHRASLTAVARTWARYRLCTGL